jgi:hypothetical protein
MLQVKAASVTSAKLATTKAPSNPANRLSEAEGGWVNVNGQGLGVRCGERCDGMGCPPPPPRDAGARLPHPPPTKADLISGECPLKGFGLEHCQHAKSPEGKEVEEHGPEVMHLGGAGDGGTRALALAHGGLARRPEQAHVARVRALHFGTCLDRWGWGGLSTDALLALG